MLRHDTQPVEVSDKGFFLSRFQLKRGYTDLLILSQLQTSRIRPIAEKRLVLTEDLSLYMT